MMVKRIVGLFAGAIFILTACGKPLPPAPQAPEPVPTPSPASTRGPNEVWMGFSEFIPTSLTVPVGTEVIWINTSREEHDVTSDEGLFFNTISPGASFSHTFNTSGFFGYYCGLHSGMAGTIIVK